MSSNSGCVTGTLRFRIAASYLFLFISLLFVGFASLYGYYAALQIHHADANLSYQFAEYSAEYLLGEEYTGPTRAIRETDVPAFIREKIHTAYPGLRLHAFFSDSPTRYWIGGEREGEVFVFDLGVPDFAASPRRFMPTGRDAHMGFEFSDEHHEVGTRESINMLLSADGRETRAATPVASNLLARVAEAGLALRPGARGKVKVGEEYWRIGKGHTFDGKIFVFAHIYNARVMQAIAITGLISLALTLLLGSALSWLLGGRVMRSLNEVIDAAGKVRAGDYSVRLPQLNGGREVDELAESFNAMVEETEAVVEDLRTISDNIAHDLKTPLTRLRGKAEMAFSSGDNAGLAEDVAEECADMLAMINAMLEIARVESGRRNTPGGRVDLAAVATESVDLFSTLAEDRGIRLSLVLPEKRAFVFAQRVHMQRLFANLIDNAIKFTPSGGRVAVAVATDGNVSTVLVTDSGLGIGKQDLPHVFDRFYRSDRSRNIPGNGLGLALVKAIAVLYGGKVSIKSEPDVGTAVTVVLPLRLEQERH